MEPTHPLDAEPLWRNEESLMPYMTCPAARDLGDSDYMMLPGARLELGPHGTPYEQLGACACRQGTGDLIEYGAQVRARARRPALAGVLPEGIPWLWLGVGAAAFLILRKKRR